MVNLAHKWSGRALGLKLEPKKDSYLHGDRSWKGLSDLAIREAKNVS